MQWEEDTSAHEYVLPDDILDMVFTMECKMLPLDHAYALSQAVQRALPWFGDEPDTGLHLVHGAESGNGWYRPEQDDGFIYLSRRTRLVLRVPKQRQTDLAGLSGQTLDIDGYSLKIGKASPRSLSATTILFSRHVIAQQHQSEPDFLQEIQTLLREQGVACRKLMCGKTSRFVTPDGYVFTRSLMLADLRVPDAVRLQQRGLGPGRKLGCGLFIPHKGISSMSSGSGEEATR